MKKLLAILLLLIVAAPINDAVGYCLSKLTKKLP